MEQCQPCPCKYFTVMGRIHRSPNLTLDYFPNRCGFTLNLSMLGRWVARHTFSNQAPHKHTFMYVYMDLYKLYRCTLECHKHKYFFFNENFMQPRLQSASRRDVSYKRSFTSCHCSLLQKLRAPVTRRHDEIVYLCFC